MALSPEPSSEEFAIHDYEGFGNLHINEYTSLQNIASYAEFINEHGELGAAVLAHTDGDIEEAQQLLDECYHGEHDSEEDFAYYWTHEVDCREIPKFLQYYIDYKAMARDFFINDFFSLEVNYKVHVLSVSARRDGGHFSLPWLNRISATGRRSFDYLIDDQYCQHC